MWLIYALGGGWGHLTRAVALARAARKVRVLTNSPYAAIVAKAMPELDLAIIPAQTPLEEARRAAVQVVRDASPEVLIVDTFPRGLGGELSPLLAALPARKVLVHRDVNPRYIASASLQQFVKDHYDLVLVPGPGEEAHFEHELTAPWLVRNANELRAGIPSGVLVCASGMPSEFEWYRAVASLLSTEITQYWPAIDRYADASVVVGGGGYNTVEECLACGVPLVARAWPRTYDRQARRLSRASHRGRVVQVHTVEEAARAALAEIRPGPRAPAHFINGTEEAVRKIERLF